MPARLNATRPQWIIALCCLTAALTTISPARAEEVTVKNDSFISGGGMVIVGDFIAGEQAGVRLTSPFNGSIVAVQVGWRSQYGGEPQSLERAIHIYDGSTFPTPGAELAFLEGPVLSDGYLNEFRYLDEASSVPLIVPVTLGQQFYVTLEFENPTDIANNTPSVFRDTNGCQANKNVLYAIPGGWLNFCSIIAGDLVIRAVVARGGACCLSDGTCIEVSQASDCTSQGGTFLGDGSDCTPNPCQQPTGACCHVDQTCTDNVDIGDCHPENGDTFYVSTACAEVPGGCPAPQGQCCLTASPGCVLTTQQDCVTSYQGIWSGPLTDCSNGCVGSCCSSTGACSAKSLMQCTADGGTWHGAGTTCTSSPCIGACCHVDGTCESGKSQAQCQAYGDVWTYNKTCEQVTCTARGACCRAGGCLLVTQAQCQSIGGLFAGIGADCTQGACVAHACCKPDGTCILNFEFQCVAIGGIYHWQDTTCTPTPCPQPTGACCYGEFCIADQLEADCTGTGGEWIGPFTTCGPPVPCAPQDPCLGIPLGDFVAPPGVNGLDIQYFVNALLAASPTQDQICRGDFSDNGALDMADVNEMVNALLGIP